MKKPRAFKRVAAKPKRPIPSNRLSNEEGKTRPSQCSESLTVAAVKPKKPQSQPQTKSGSSFPIPDILPEKMTILPFSFFQIDALELAPRLLGKFLRREDVVLQITEVMYPSIFYCYVFFRLKLVCQLSVCFPRKWRNSHLWDWAEKLPSRKTSSRCVSNAQISCCFRMKCIKQNVWLNDL